MSLELSSWLVCGSGALPADRRATGPNRLQWVDFLAAPLAATDFVNRDRPDPGGVPVAHVTGGPDGRQVEQTTGAPGQRRPDLDHQAPSAICTIQLRSDRDRIKPTRKTATKRPFARVSSVFAHSWFPLSGEEKPGFSLCRSTTVGVRDAVRGETLHVRQENGFLCYLCLSSTHYRLWDGQSHRPKGGQKEGKWCRLSGEN